MGYNFLPDVGNTKIMAKRLLALSALLLAPFGLLAQSPPLDLKFGGHTLGEAADVFFSTARVSDSKQLTKDYCKSLLDDAKTREQVQQYEDVQKNGGVFALGKKDFSFLDVGNCKQVMVALEGKQANVGARLAFEIGGGSAMFASGRLSAVNLTMDSTYADVVSDMEKRFGSPGRNDIVSRSAGPRLRRYDGNETECWQQFGRYRFLIISLPSSASLRRHTIRFFVALPRQNPAFFRRRPAKPRYRAIQRRYMSRRVGPRVNSITEWLRFIPKLPDGVGSKESLRWP